MFIDIIAYLTAALVIFPLASLFIIYFLLLKLTEDKKFSLSWTINCGTILLIFSLSVTIQELWHIQAMWLIFLMLSVIAGGLLYLQYSIRGEIYWMRWLNGTLKLSFLLFAPIHVILYLWAVIDAIINI